MIANALLAAAAVFLALLFWLMQECRFLLPYKDVLYHQYGAAIVAWSAVLFVNVFAAFYAIGRTLFLKDTGQKLAHVEKQIRTGASVSEELTSRLMGESGLTDDF